MELRPLVLCKNKETTWVEQKIPHRLPQAGYGHAKVLQSLRCHVYRAYMSLDL